MHSQFWTLQTPPGPFEVTRVRDGVHGFNSLNEVKGASAIDIDGEQYVAVGGDEGITLVHVRPYGQPDISVTASGSLSSTLDDNGNTDTVTLHSGAQSFRLTLSLNYAPAADTSVEVVMNMANYTIGHRAPYSVVSQTFTFRDTDWNMPQSFALMGLNNDWDREYVLITLYTAKPAAQEDPEQIPVCRPARRGYLRDRRLPVEPVDPGGGRTAPAHGPEPVPGPGHGGRGYGYGEHHRDAGRPGPRRTGSACRCIVREATRQMEQTIRCRPASTLPPASSPGPHRSPSPMMPWPNPTRV